MGLLAAPVVRLEGALPVRLSVVSPGALSGGGAHRRGAEPPDLAVAAAANTLLGYAQHFDPYGQLPRVATDLRVARTTPDYAPMGGCLPVDNPVSVPVCRSIQRSPGVALELRGTAGGGGSFGTMSPPMHNLR
jgi:hypothetical protein